VWQRIHEELTSLDFTVISVALDKSADDARPWIEAARPTHPSLIDTQHVVADLYNMVNVPTVVWIDERGRIARPNDVAFGSDTFRTLTGIDSEKHAGALRAWARGEAQPLSEEEIRCLQTLPDRRDQEARAEFSLGFWLFQHDRKAAAERHFLKAGELAPQDFMIRRGSLPLRGIDPMGPEFARMLGTWTAAGNNYYEPLPE
jgi:hypothetical protein